MAQVSGAGRLRTPRGPRVALAALACWATGTLIFTGSPEDSTWRVAAVNVVYFTAVAFALVFLARTASATRGRERLFWGLLVAGSLVGLVGGLGWGGIQRPAFTALEFSYQHAAHLAFYLLFVCALLLLVSSTTSRITLIAFLDSLCIMLSVGILVWYFFLGRMVVEDSSGLSWTVLADFSWPSFGVALLFLCLVVYSTTGRSPFVGLLTAGFLAFALADGWYLGARSEGSHGIVGWPDLLWTLGLILLGLAALHAAPVSTTRQRIGSWWVFAFWLGPLSPPIQLAIVLAYGATHPPLPSYVLAGSAIVLLFLAVRIALVYFVTHRLGREQEEEIRKLEQDRVLFELHDTVKQSVHGISLALRAAMEAVRRGERDDAWRMLDRALEAAQEAEYNVSEPYVELQAVDGERPSNPTDYLRHRLKKFED